MGERKRATNHQMLREQAEHHNQNVIIKDQSEVCLGVVHSFKLFPFPPSLFLRLFLHLSPFSRDGSRAEHTLTEFSVKVACTGVHKCTERINLDAITGLIQSTEFLPSSRRKQTWHSGNFANHTGSSETPTPQNTPSHPS